MKQHQTNSFISRAAAMLLTVIMAFAGAQTAGATFAMAYSVSADGTTYDDITTGSVTAGEQVDMPAFEAERTVDGVRVVVRAPEGTFPAGAELRVEAATAAQRELAGEAVGEVRDEDERVAVSRTVDVGVVDPATGQRLQPAGDRKVEVSFVMAEVADQNLTTNVYHVTGDGAKGGLAAESLDVSRKTTPETGEETTAVVQTDGFSLYTVEFTYGELTYVMEGDATIPLADVLAAVGLAGEPTAAETSDPSFFSTARDDAGVWQLTSHAPFSTTEWLRVTINDVTYVIVVTDDNPDAISISGPITINNSTASSYNNRTITGTVEADSMSDSFKQYSSSASHFGAIIIDGTTVNLTIKDLSITAIANNAQGAVCVSPVLLCNNATLNLTLEGNNALTACLGGAGIRVPEGCTLTITAESTGSLTATGGDFGGTVGNNLSGGAGIGTEDTPSSPDAHVQNGTITINGGTITARGGASASVPAATGGAAGIGGSDSTEGGTVTINGGTVNATGGYYAAGIGGGAGGNAPVVISGGTVNATAGGGTSGYVGAAIGCGYDSGSSGVTSSVVTITGGNVTADGNIGHPNSGDYGTDVLNLGNGQAIISCTGEITSSSATYHSIKVTVYDPSITTALDGKTATLKLDNGAPASGTAQVTQDGTATFSAQRVVSYGNADTRTMNASVTIGDTFHPSTTSSVTLNKTKKASNIYWGYRLHVVGTVFDQSIDAGQTGTVRIGATNVVGGVTITQGMAAVDGWLNVAEGEGISDSSDYSATVSVTVGSNTFSIRDVSFTKTNEHQKTGSFSSGVDNIYYIDENGTSQTITDFTRLDTNSSALVDDGWYVVWPGETVTVSNRLSVVGTVYLVLGDGATLDASAGIAVNKGATLYVYSQDANTGKLTATGANQCAGIGSNNGQDAGTINLYGGVIHATGTVGGAGIGGGRGTPDHSSGRSGDITIDDRAIIEAHGSEGGAGIGGGRDGDGQYITISGGTVEAYGSYKTCGGAGIGGGGRSLGGDTGSYGGIIRISGTADVIARGGESAAGIGCGSSTDGTYYGRGGNITIDGEANVTAEGGKMGAGIGSGRYGAESCITIKGGTVRATGGEGSAGIGQGSASNTTPVGDSSIVISAGEVTAVGGQRGPGIGSNGGKDLPFINITDGKVTATGNGDASGIGWGATAYGSSNDKVFISGGQVTANGINASKGMVYLGWKNEATDYITCNGKYKGDAGIILYDNYPFAVQGSGEQATTNPINFNNATIVPMPCVKLVPGEGTGFTYSVPVKHGSNYTVPESPVSSSFNYEPPEGKRFHHWQKDDDAEHQYMPGEVIENVDRSFTLTAIWWDANPVTVGSAVSDCISVSSATAYTGETVTVTLTYGDTRTYTEGTLKATYTLNDQQKTLPLTQDPSNTRKYTFTMPAAPVNVTGEFTHVLAAYVNAKGEAMAPKEVFENVVPSSGDVSWGEESQEKWYVVWDDAEISGNVSFSGNVNLILTDGATLTARKGIVASADWSNLTIWCQQGGTGTLVVQGTLQYSGISAGAFANCKITINGGNVNTTGDTYYAGISWGYLHSGNTITINGGVVTATGGEYAAGIGGDAMQDTGGSVIITGGTVVANGGGYAAGIGLGIKYDQEQDPFTISISGGSVKATGGLIDSDHCDGIGYGQNGKGTCTITLSYGDDRNASICSNRYRGTVILEKDFRDAGSDAKFPATESQDLDAIAGKTLIPVGTYVPGHFDKTGDNEYTIHTATGWDAFCDVLALNDKGVFSGKTVKLDDDITVTRMAGTSNHDFCGTFDGDGHTLTFNYGTAGSYASDEYAAPFHYVSNVGSTAAAFRNLHVAGHIYTSAKYAAGLIAQHWGTVNVENCRVSTVIHSSVNGDGTHGGFEAECKGVLNITGCVFDGKLLTTTTNGTDNCGGFVGWHYGGTTNISNSLYAPAAIATGETEVGPGTAGQNPSATFGRNAVNSINNSYYTTALGTAQGKQRHTVTAGENVTIEPIALTGSSTAYDVSGITAYSGGGLSLDNGNGATLYYGSGDVVSLTLANTATSAPTGYQYDGYTYTASSGTLSGSTLTMRDRDVEVSVKWAPDPAHFSANAAGTEYTIHTATGWDVFCDLIAADENMRVFSGKTVKLGDDISVSRAAGDSYAFTGTFDGQGHTLRFTINTEGSDSRIGVAPFHNVRETNPTGSSEVSHPAIRNLNVVADITTGRVNASGLVARSRGTLTIEGCTVSGTIRTSDYGAGGFIGGLESKACVYVTNCVSSITIIDSKNSTSGSSNGGFGGTVWSGCTLHIEGCLFNGKLLATNETNRTCGGFVGNNTGTVTITNCVYAPAALADDETWERTTRSATFVSGGEYGSDATITNSYYTQDFNDGTHYTGQGKQLRSIAAGENISVEHAGVATAYGVSGITAYKASDAHGDNDPFIDGLVYNEVLYAGSGDAVSLTLTNSGGEAPLGYKNGDYIITGGATLSGSTLIMSDADVTVSFTPGDLRSTGEAVTVSYIDADGQSASHAATAIDGTEGSLGQYDQETWYFVGAEISYSGEIVCKGNVNIILADGNTMTVNNNDGIFEVGNTNEILTIYGQTLGTGTLDITATNKGINYGIVVIRGGTVTATSTNSNGIYATGYVTITGGKVTATGSYQDGIFADGDITLGCTNASDFIKASSYNPGPNGGSVNIADGQTLYDEDGREYSGYGVDFDKLAGKTLRPYDCRLALSDAADNSAAIAAANGKVYNVTLQGRTLYKDGAWNTLVLPFAIDDFTGTPLEGATVKELNATTSNLNNGTLTLNFSDNLTAIEAGTPYIVKWAKTDGYDEADPETRDVKNPVFTGVTISGTEPTPVTFTGGSFVGQYSLFSIVANDAVLGENQGYLNEIIMLGSGNKLGYSQNPRTLHSFRAHFYVPANGGGQQARSFVLDFGEGEQTGILSTTNFTNFTNSAAAWYDMQGRKLNAQPTKKGLYIVNGKKIVVK